MPIVLWKLGNAGRGRGGCRVVLSREISAFAQEKEQMQTKIDRIR